jgi:2,5-dioxopentanoate dehydrogenase
MNDQITGALFLGPEERRGFQTFCSYDPVMGSPLEPAFSEATAEDVVKACSFAEEAFDAYRSIPYLDRANFLETIAEQILALGDALIVRAAAETALPKARLESERGRAVYQLRMFAGLIRSGEWLGLQSDPADPERKPLPKPELMLRHIPLGPVAVFGASNFPLAFSVAGGDTASALAAGCTVVVKGHPAHPGTCELVGRAVRQAVKECGMPPGVFSLLQGRNNSVGQALVSHPAIQAVGFTGSRSGGLALVAIAASRTQPIPVFAEMSSVNPVILLPDAVKERAESLATGFIASITLGAGQFCTNPGLVFVVESNDLHRFVQAAAEALRSVRAVPMLSEAIRNSFAGGIRMLERNPDVELLARGAAGEGSAIECGALFQASAETFLSCPELAHEVFGASSLVIRCESVQQIQQLIEAMEGQLTITLHMSDGDTARARALLPTLERKAGRILVNGWPTGVEVSRAMVHGGPYPATSDVRSTSVGTLAIQRFLRPVCYQDLPADLLPIDFQRVRLQTNSLRKETSQS